MDTIAAIATPSGRGGVGIVRVSGPRSLEVCQQLTQKTPAPRVATLAQFKDSEGQLIDEGLILFFKGPHSFTGEDVLELQGHGGMVVMDLLLKTVLAIPGLRLAKPGEFSERAFLNDKIDLVKAEAVADLIDAASTQAVRCALRSLSGEFSSVIHALVESLIRLRLYVEACIDFPEEDIDFISDGRVAQEIAQIAQQLAGIFAQAQRGSLLKEGMTVVIAGRPNAGKSSLLNALSQRDAAIVTALPGTTRDILTEKIQIAGVPLQVIDTAGLRETEDLIEQEGIKRAKQAISTADHILVMVDITAGQALPDILQEFDVYLSEGKPYTIVFNKIDQCGESPQVKGQGELVYVSAKLGLGINLLEERLLQSVGYQSATEGVFMARRRHLQALEQAQLAVSGAQVQLLESQALELVAEELRRAQVALSEITGEFTADDLLGEIFSRFCIGK